MERKPLSIPKAGLEGAKADAPFERSRVDRTEKTVETRILMIQ